MEERVDKVVLGWREYVAIPEWGIERIRAKVDTGARTSAIHVEALEELPDGNLRFKVVRSLKDESKNVIVVAPVMRRTTVRSSHGTTQPRFVVSARVELGGVQKTVELSLVGRRHMLCRMLVGRSMLSGSYVVDVDEKYRAGKEPR